MFFNSYKLQGKQKTRYFFNQENQKEIENKMRRNGMNCQCISTVGTYEVQTDKIKHSKVFFGYFALRAFHHILFHFRNLIQSKLHFSISPCFHCIKNYFRNEKNDQVRELRRLKLLIQVSYINWRFRPYTLRIKLHLMILVILFIHSINISNKYGKHSHLATLAIADMANMAQAQ